MEASLPNAKQFILKKFEEIWSCSLEAFYKDALGGKIRILLYGLVWTHVKAVASRKMTVITVPGAINWV